MNAVEFEAALAEARTAVLTARDPAAAAARLARWAQREQGFRNSPASLSEAELITARCNGVRLQEFSASRGRS